MRVRCVTNDHIDGTIEPPDYRPSEVTFEGEVAGVYVDHYDRTMLLIWDDAAQAFRSGRTDECKVI